MAYLRCSGNLEGIYAYHDVDGSVRFYQKDKELKIPARDFTAFVRKLCVGKQNVYDDKGATYNGITAREDWRDHPVCCNDVNCPMPIGRHLAIFLSYAGCEDTIWFSIELWWFFIRDYYRRMMKLRGWKPASDWD